MRNKVYRFVTSVGGLGYIPFAPGTITAAFATGCWFFLTRNGGNGLFLQLSLIIAATAAGLLCSAKICTSENKDPSAIVIDELAGMWIALFLIPFSVVNYLLAFLLFRFFDIAKPLGIRKMETIEKGWGVMLDDLLAGLYSNITLWLFISFNIW